MYLVFVQEGSVGHTQLLTLLHVHFYLCVRACMRVYACKCVCAYVAACTHMDKRSTEL